MKLEITNTLRAPQGVHTTSGVKFIPVGETKTVDVPRDWFERLHALEDAGLLSVTDPQLDSARSEVEAHRANIMEKLNANTVADLLKTALGQNTAKV